MTVIRDHAWVEREYNREKYPIVLRAARRALEAGERSLARVMGRIIAEERGALSVAMRRSVLADGEAHTLPLAFASAGMSGFVTQALAEACAPDTATVVELGAGWGRNLFQLHLSGFAPAHARYFALEYAATARATADLVSAVEPQLSFTAAAFDYHAPDYGMIPLSEAPAVLATVHSVEQIPHLKPEVFLRLIERLPRLRAVHLEPVGWQLPKARLQGRSATSSPGYAVAHDYNRNFWTVLESLDSAGVIVVEDVVADVLGLNPSNPATLIRWRTKN